MLSILVYNELAIYAILSQVSNLPILSIDEFLGRLDWGLLKDKLIDDYWSIGFDWVFILIRNSHQFFAYECN